MTAKVDEALRQGDAVRSAFGVIWQLVNVLNVAISNHSEFEWSIKAGERELPPVMGKDGKLYANGEADGSCEFHLSIKPPAPGQAKSGGCV